MMIIPCQPSTPLKTRFSQRFLMFGIVHLQLFDAVGMNLESVA